MCWNSYGRRWEREPERTFEPAKTDDLRIADSDRERAIAQLSKHAGDGRLTLEEFEARVAEVYTARTYADLWPVFRGLPSYEHAPSVRRIDLERIVRPLVVLALLVVAAIAWGPWVLLIGLWVLFARRGWGHHRGWHHVEHERPRDEELTTV